MSNVAPADDSVKIPDSVKRAAALAESYYKDAPTPAADAPAAPAQVDTAAPAQVDTADAPAPQPDAAPAPAPQPDPAVQPPAPDVAQADWQNRYHSMEGRYKQSQRTLGSMQEQMTEMGAELVRMQQLLGTSTTTQNPPDALNQDDVKNYGNELIETIQRNARAAVEPDLKRVQGENIELKQSLAREAQQRVYRDLAQQLPNWGQINTSPRFKEWCRLQDFNSGIVRGRLLMDAFKAADAPRMVNIFKSFLSEEVATGQRPDPQAQAQSQPAAPRVPAVPLSSLAAPGRARPATGDSSVPATKPVFTHADIKQFYVDVRKGVYAGRDEAKAADEAMIFAAQRDGRVR